MAVIECAESMVTTSDQVNLNAVIVLSIVTLQN